MSKRGPGCFLHASNGHIGLAISNIVADSIVEKDGFLCNFANLIAQRAQAHVAQIVTIDENAARSHIEEARDEVDQG